jgi:hypothetical protein
MHRQFANEKLNSILTVMPPGPEKLRVLVLLSLIDGYLSYNEYKDQEFLSDLKHFLTEDQ